MQVAAGLQRARPEQPAEPAGRRRHVHHQQPVRPNEHYGQVSVQMLVYVVFVHFVCCYEVPVPLLSRKLLLISDFDNSSLIIVQRAYDQNYRTKFFTNFPYRHVISVKIRIVGLDLFSTTELWIRVCNISYSHAFAVFVSYSHAVFVSYSHAFAVFVS